MSIFKLRYFLLLFSLAAGGVNAQELIVNRTFDQNVDGWNNFNGYGVFEWTATRGLPAGSLRLSGDRAAAVPDCVPAAAGDDVTISTDVFAQTTTDYALCSLTGAWYDTDDCTGSPKFFPSRFLTTEATNNQWLRLEISTSHATNTRSFQAVVAKNADRYNDDLCFFDNVSAVQQLANPPAPIPVLDARGLVTLVVVLGLAALVVLRRRL